MILLLTAVLWVASGPLFQVVITALMNPILRAWRSLIASTPPGVIWVIFVAMAVILVGASFPWMRLSKRETVEPKTEPGGNLHRLLQEIEPTRGGWKRNSRLALRLETLAVKILAYRLRLTPGEVRQWLSKPAPGIPEEVRIFLLTAGQPENEAFLSRLANHLPWKTSSTAEDKEYLNVLAYLEKQMEKIDAD